MVGTMSGQPEGVTNRFTPLETINDIIKLNDKHGVIDAKDVSDGYHTFEELYEFRKQYNAALFNIWSKLGLFDVHKSLNHHDEEGCFGTQGKWFIVVAILPTGQISNHYKLADWNLFQVPSVEYAKYPWDGHTPQDVVKRLNDLNKS